MLKDPFHNLYNIIAGSNKDLKAALFKNLGNNNPNSLAIDDFGLTFTPDNIEDYARVIGQRYVVFHDQEPIDLISHKDGWIKTKLLFNKGECRHILSNSELNSREKNSLLELTGWDDFYWFSNGFLSLEWYRYYQYDQTLENNWKPKHLFSCYNRIIKDRKHRTVIAKELLKLDHQKIILSYTGETKEETSIVINTKNANKENLSFTIVTDDFKNSFCHIVTERLFYEERLHLTEKIFRPIVCCRPFILVSTPGSLNYLKSYGFKTFDKFWDESYDNIEDHNQRLEAIKDLIKYLNKQDYVAMLNEMQDILLYNRNHFYNEFRQIITTELWTNLENILNTTNNKKGIWKQIIATLSDNQIELLKADGEISADDIPFNQFDYLNASVEEQQECFRQYIKHFRFIYRTTLYLDQL